MFLYEIPIVIIWGECYIINKRKFINTGKERKKMSYTITDQFPGGNITVIECREDHASVKINYRDSQPWCYWAFKVCGAAGKQITFDFGEDAVGYFGPAVSHDLINWHWSEPQNYRSGEEERFQFTYTFAEEDEEVYFSHNMLYCPERFEQIDFMKKSVLCVDRDGTKVPMAEMGEGEQVILLTARHHACEAPANYILEGVLREFKENLPKSFRIITVPFVDMAGVVAGDQGKDRFPHDHNRDYVEESIYPTVNAMKELVVRENIRYVFDFHSPCHLGGGNDCMSLVNAYESMRNDMSLLSRLFAGELTEECFVFRDGTITWREQPVNGTFSAYCGALDKVQFVATMENPYFGEQGNVMTQDSYLATGRAFGRAVRKLIESKE